MATPKAFPPFPFPTRFGPDPTAINVGTTPTLVLRNNPNRVYWLIHNTSANTIYLGFNSEVSATRGLTLTAGGGGASMQYDEDGDVVGNAVHLLATGAGSTFYGFEIEKVDEYRQPAAPKRVA